MKGSLLGLLFRQNHTPGMLSLTGRWYKITIISSGILSGQLWIIWVNQVLAAGIIPVKNPANIGKVIYFPGMPLIVVILIGPDGENQFPIIEACCTIILKNSIWQYGNLNMIP